MALTTCQPSSGVLPEAFKHKRDSKRRRKRSGIPEHVKERPLVDPAAIKINTALGQANAYRASRCYATIHKSVRAARKSITIAQIKYQ
ncbi:hypothetical protein NDU88_007080 [Pleurodeles waltl]|uniref:Uncharacterized protein n=1 Tax=Pleurodeles waltl TaxID=8319 RepID=A0AAV7VRL1_PLEWA|nr:hypothetical protein NDU88_007080 [Pleurodeles waltl]